MVRMVKRAIGLIIVLSFVLLLVQYGSNIFKKDHENVYTINHDSGEFKIKEVYQKENGNAYYLEISNGDITFNYTVDNYFNKQKNIINDIEYVTQDGMMCIFPIFMKDDVNVNIQCREGKQLYSYEMVKNDSRVISFIDSLKSKGYSIPAWEVREVTSNKATVSSTFNENILDTDTIVVWIYKGLELVSKEKNDFLSLYGFDKYENTHGKLVDHYYIAPIYDNNRVFDFSKISIINLDSKLRKEIELEQPLQQDTYINGVVDNKLYYFDPDNLIQIQVDPIKTEQKIVGNQRDNAQYYDGEFKSVNIYDFVSSKKVFQPNYQDNEKLMSYQPTNIYESNSNYYYSTSDGGFYRLNKNNLESPVLLWKNANMKEVKIIDNSIYFITGDTLYFYQEEYGLRSVMKNQEWNYNSNNIFDVYRKSK